MDPSNKCTHSKNGPEHPHHNSDKGREPIAEPRNGNTGPEGSKTSFKTMIALAKFGEKKATLAKFDESQKNVERIKEWINHNQFDGLAEEEMAFLDRPSFTPDELRVGMFYAHRKASNALDEYVKLHKDTMKPYNDFLTLQSFLPEEFGDADSRNVIPVDTVSMSFRDPHFYLDPRFKRTVTVLGYVYHSLKSEIATLEEEAESLNLLCTWINDIESRHRTNAEEPTYLYNPKFTPRILKEGVIYAKNRCNERLVEYERLAHLHMTGDPEQIKKRIEVMEQVSKYHSGSIVDFWRMDEGTIRVSELYGMKGQADEVEEKEDTIGICRLFRKSFALLCATLHEIDGDIKYLKGDIAKGRATGDRKSDQEGER